MNAQLQSDEIGRPSSADSFATLHARLQQPLKRYFAGYRLNAQDVEDLTQEVFLRLAAIGRMIVLRKPDVFVFTLARNLVRDRARRAHTRAGALAITLEEAELTSQTPTPEEALDHETRLSQALSVLGRLKPTTRHAFYLSRIYGHNYAETAAEMGVSVSMVEKHVMTAIAILREIAKQEG